MAHASELTEELLRRQNTDGGWGYQGATSWTEPTALAVLALESFQIPHTRGVQWLLARQRQDGGWAPSPTVNQSTSVTSTACLAISASGNQSADTRAVQWILGQIKPKLGLFDSLKFRLEGMPPSESVMGGSPWYPQTASWIAPTAMSVLALENIAIGSADTKLGDAIREGKQYILSRQCRDGGWNHGGTQFRSADASSYPEMTGMALLALDETEQVQKSLSLAQQMQYHPESSEGQSWLTLALRKHQRPVASVSLLPPRTTRDLALCLLARYPDNRLLGSTT